MVCVNHGSQLEHRLWHYTTGVHLPLILQSGMIRPENPLYLQPPQLPVTWFSLNQVWEPTASKAILAPEVGPTILRRATADACCGLFRIAIEQGDAPFRVHQLIGVARANRRTVKDLCRVGKRCGACPDDWRFTPNAVLAERWREVQMWVEASNTWVSYQPDHQVHSGLCEFAAAIG
jgi:hypothetical protein